MFNNLDSIRMVELSGVTLTESARIRLLTESFDQYKPLFVALERWTQGDLSGEDPSGALASDLIDALKSAIDQQQFLYTGQMFRGLQLFDYNGEIPHNISGLLKYCKNKDRHTAVASWAKTQAGVDQFFEISDPDMMGYEEPNEDGVYPYLITVYLSQRNGTGIDVEKVWQFIQDNYPDQAQHFPYIKRAAEVTEVIAPYGSVGLAGVNILDPLNPDE
jgi:hypothetical protein